MFWGIVLFLVQVLYWLKSGQWVAVPVLDLFITPAFVEPHILGMTPHDLVPNFLGRLFPWLGYPTDWFGVHKFVHAILQFVPLSVVLVAIGFTISFQSLRFDETEDGRQRPAA